MTRAYLVNESCTAEIEARVDKRLGGMGFTLSPWPVNLDRVNTVDEIAVLVLTHAVPTPLESQRMVAANNAGLRIVVVLIEAELQPAGAAADLASSVVTLDSPKLEQALRPNGELSVHETSSGAVASTKSINTNKCK
jgi:hypothetical protein